MGAYFPVSGFYLDWKMGDWMRNYVECEYTAVPQMEIVMFSGLN